MSDKLKRDVLFMKSQKPNINQLINACRVVRTAGQQISDEHKIPYFSTFPRGWCGCISRVLGAWLVDRYPNVDFFYVCGYRNSSHAWIEYNRIILDITADQFPDCDEKIIVMPYSESKFHQTFEIKDRRLCHIEDADYPEESQIYHRVEEIFRSAHY